MDKIQRGNRKSSLKGYEDFAEDRDEINYQYFIMPFHNLKRYYYGIINRRHPKPKCYAITYRNVPDIIYIAFGEKDKCKSEATKYFRDNFHPAFAGNAWRKCHIEARAIRHPEFDQYIKEKRVPILDIMTLGITFPCSICGKDNFTLNDLRKDRKSVVRERV